MGTVSGNVEDELQKAQKRLVELEKRNEELANALKAAQQLHAIKMPDASFCTKDSTIEEMVHLPLVCRHVLDTLPFQRLRDLLQLGGSYWVYITAHHKRFDHCMGTANLAFQLITHLAQAQPELQISHRDVIAVTLAAQCHDLGHGLLSHAWDAMVLPQLYQLEKERRAALNLPAPELPPEHEDISVMLFKYLAHDIREKLLDEGMILEGPESDLTFVCELINPKRDFSRIPTEEWPFSGRSREKAFLWEIVSNKRSGIDVDKLDYIRRDCHNTGVKGVFEVDRLIHNTRVRRSTNGLLTICWPEKEVENLYEIFHTRLSLHRRVYQHRVAKVVEGMIGKAMVEIYPAMTINGSQGTPLTLYEACFDPMAFLCISDWMIQFVLHGRHIRVDWDHEGSKRASALVRDVFHRKLWKTLGVSFVSKDILKDKDRVRDQIHELLPVELQKVIPREHLLVQRNTFSYGMGEKNPIEQIVFFYGKRKGGEGYTLKTTDVSKMLPASFSEDQVRCVLKSTDPTHYRAAQVAFDKWCDNHGCSKPRRDLDHIIDTPNVSQKHAAADLSHTTPSKRRCLFSSKSEPIVLCPSAE